MVFSALRFLKIFRKRLNLRAHGLSRASVQHGEGRGGVVAAAWSRARGALLP
jgi:hypothetical protein